MQTNTIALHTGRQVPAVSSPGWLNNATVGVAGPIIVDGAKRDRSVSVCKSSWRNSLTEFITAQSGQVRDVFQFPWSFFD